MIKMVHTFGCGKAAFFIDFDSIEVAKGSEISSSDVYLLDGTHPLSGDLVLCDSCGYPVDTYDLEMEVCTKEEETQIKRKDV